MPASVTPEDQTNRSITTYGIIAASLAILVIVVFIAGLAFQNAGNGTTAITPLPNNTPTPVGNVITEGSRTKDQVAKDVLESKRGFIEGETNPIEKLSLDSCLSNTEETYAKKWDELCEQNALAKGCQLPDEQAQELEDYYESLSDGCFQDYF